MNQCNACKKLTKNSKYCSRSCAGIVNGKNFPKRKKSPRFCFGCRCQLPADRLRRKYCSVCDLVLNENRPLDLANMTLEELKSHCNFEGRPRSYLHGYVRMHCGKLHRASWAACSVCGYDKHVELCHIRPIKDYPLTATLGEINDRSNIVGLCPNHHWELDSGSLDISSSN